MKERQRTIAAWTQKWIEGLSDDSLALFLKLSRTQDPRMQSSIQKSRGQRLEAEWQRRQKAKAEK